MRLPPEWIDQTISTATMLHALADRIDTWIEGLHGVVDQHAAVAAQAAALREFGLRANADRHHHQRRIDDRAVLEPDAADANLAEDRFGLRSEERRLGKVGVSPCRSRWSPEH